MTPTIGSISVVRGCVVAVVAQNAVSQIVISIVMNFHRTIQKSNRLFGFCSTIVLMRWVNRNSRRLRGAADRIDEEVKRFPVRSRNFSVDQCEGDAILYNFIQTKLRMVAELLILRFKYLKVVPSRFVKTDSVEGAEAFLRGATSRPSDEQDPLTNYLHETHRASLLARANGDVCTVALMHVTSRQRRHIRLHQAVNAHQSKHQVVQALFENGLPREAGDSI